jgi:hypothetical protein
MQRYFHPETRGIVFNFISLMALSELIFSLIVIIEIILYIGFDITVPGTLNENSRSEFYCPIVMCLITLSTFLLFGISNLISFTVFKSVISKTPLNYKCLNIVMYGIIIISVILSIWEYYAAFNIIYMKYDQTIN